MSQALTAAGERSAASPGGREAAAQTGACRGGVAGGRPLTAASLPPQACSAGLRGVLGTGAAPPSSSRARASAT
jgi:hypothetical protein